MFFGPISCDCFFGGMRIRTKENQQPTTPCDNYNDGAHAGEDVPMALNAWLNRDVPCARKEIHRKPQDRCFHQKGLSFSAVEKLQLIECQADGSQWQAKQQDGVPQRSRSRKNRWRSNIIFIARFLLLATLKTCGLVPGTKVLCLIVHCLLQRNCLVHCLLLRLHKKSN